MNDLKLYLSLLSANGRKVLAMCREIDINISIEDVNVYVAEGLNEEYLKMNPLGQIPLLTNDELIIRESNAIMIYLSEKYGDLSLYGTTPELSAQINQWLFWESSQWQPALTTVMAPVVGHKLLPEIITMPQSRPDWHSEECKKQLVYLENYLSNKKWLVNNRLSIADFSVAAMTTYFNACEFPEEDYPNISSWLGRISERTAWKETQHSLWK